MDFHFGIPSDFVVVSDLNFYYRKEDFRGIYLSIHVHFVNSLDNSLYIEKDIH